MSTGASQIFVERVREAAAILGIPIGGGGGGIYSLLFAILKNFGASTTTATGEHYRFDTIDAESAGGEITVTSGANDQTDGLITLPQGHVFLCMAYIYVNSITGPDFVRSSWRNNTDAVLFGGETQQGGDTTTGDRNSLDIPIGIIDTAAEAKEIECRQTLRSAGGVTYTGRSWALIREL